MANSEAEKIKVISESFVRPQHEVEAANQPYYLGPIDLIMLSIDPIQKGLLFTFPDYPTRPDIQSIVERLKHSLSVALLHFYPLAGRFETKQFEDDHACLIYVDCLKGPGSRLVHARYVDLTVSDILCSVDVHPAVRLFFDLGERTVNNDGHSKPLLSIQVTELLDGVFIGFSINHCVADGTSFIHFIAVLSEIFRSENDQIQISRTPLKKMFAPDAYGPIFKLPYLEHKEFVTRYDPGVFRERIFHFTPESMARLKAMANEELRGSDKTISSFMALSGLLWRSIIRARNPAGHEKTSCALLLNARSRVNPPLSDDYFGNFLSQAAKVCTVEELLGKKFGWAAKFLSEEVNKSAGALDGLLNMLAESPFVFQPGTELPELNRVENTVVIGGAARFDMYGPEFGLGRAVGVRMGYANKDNGKVTANPGCEGGGSVDLEICLKPAIMEALEADQEFMSFVFI